MQALAPSQQHHDNSTGSALSSLTHSSPMQGHLTRLFTYLPISDEDGLSPRQLKDSYLEIENVCAELMSKRLLSERKLSSKKDKILQFKMLHAKSHERMISAVESASQKAKIRNKALLEQAGNLTNVISHVIGDAATEAALIRAQEAYKRKLTIALPAYTSAVLLKEQFLGQAHVLKSRASESNVNAQAEQLFEKAHANAMGWTQKQDQMQAQTQRMSSQKGSAQSSVSGTSSESSSYPHIDSDASTVARVMYADNKHGSLVSPSAGAISVLNKSENRSQSSSSEDSRMFAYSDSDGKFASNKSSSGSSSSSSHFQQPSRQYANKHESMGEESKGLSLDGLSLITASTAQLGTDNKSGVVNTDSIDYSSSQSIFRTQLTYDNSYVADISASAAGEAQSNVTDPHLDSSLYFAMAGGSSPHAMRAPPNPRVVRGSSSASGTPNRGVKALSSPISSSRDAKSSPTLPANGTSGTGITMTRTKFDNAINSTGRTEQSKIESRRGNVAPDFSMLFDENEIEADEVLRRYVQALACMSSSHSRIGSSVMMHLIYLYCFMQALLMPLIAYLYFRARLLVKSENVLHCAYFVRSNATFCSTPRTSLSSMFYFNSPLFLLHNQILFIF